MNLFVYREGILDVKGARPENLESVAPGLRRTGATAIVPT